MRTYNPHAGSHIRQATEELARLADEHEEPVSMKFNDVEIVAQPGGFAGGNAEVYQRLPLT